LGLHRATGRSGGKWITGEFAQFLNPTKPEAGFGEGAIRMCLERMLMV
jgi:hypothetical protein